MAETEGLHVELTADAQSFISAINNAKNKLAHLAEETKILKQGEKDIQAALAESKKRYGENSIQVEKLTADLLDNAREQEKLKQEIKEVNATLDTATKEYKKYGNSAKQSFDSVSQQSQKATDTLKSGFNAVKGLIVGYAGKTLYEALVGTNADYEQSMTSFEVLLQSADKADAMMQKLEKMGASTPFELSDLTAATEQLLAYGTAEADIETRLQQLGDLSKGNAEKFESITNAYGRMLAKGKVSLEELNMFTEAGVPILEELQTQYGVTGEKMFKMISDGKVGVEGINSAMKSMTSEGGQFFGMMEKQSKTLDGMLSTMSDNATMFARMVGEESFAILKTEFESLLATINEMSESGELQEKAQEIGNVIASLVSLLGTLLEFGMNHITLITNATGAILTYKAAYTLLNGVMGIGQAIQTTINLLSGKSVVCKNLETGATIVLTQAELAEAKAKKAAIVAQEGLNAAQKANVFLALASVVLTAITAFVSYKIATKDATEENRKLTLSNKELADSYNSAIESIEAKRDEELAEAMQVERLSEKILKLGDEYNNCEKDSEEARKKEEEFKVVADQLAERIPEITDLLFDETGQINVQSTAVKNLTDRYVELAKAKAFANAAEEMMTESAKLVIEAENKQKNADDFLKNQVSYFMRDDGSFGMWGSYKVRRAQGELWGANDDLDAANKVLAQNEENYETYQKRVNELMDSLFPDTDGGDDPPGGVIPSGTSKKNKSAAELAKEAYEAKRKASDEYIRQRDLYDDWGEDSKIDALQRIMDYTDDALNNGVLSWEEYIKEIGGLSDDLYSELKDMVEEEKERVKEQLEEERDLKKQLIEDELEFRKQQYDKEIEYLDELKAKRNEEKEDEDYAERMARLQAKLEYEMDDDNRRALQKEIDELQEEIDDTKFDREIERKKSVLENAKESKEQNAQQQIDQITAYYEERMSDINIAQAVYDNLDLEKFKEMGELMGQNLAAGISGALNPTISAINKLITLGGSIQSPVNSNVSTTDNSISINQYNNGVSSAPTYSDIQKSVDDYMFLNGRL